MSDDIAIRNHPDLSRYEIHVGGVLAGFAEYLLPDDQHVDFTHTEVGQEFGGQGLAGRLVEHALADVRRQGKRVIPHCPYVARWLGEHHEYDDMIDWP